MATTSDHSGWALYCWPGFAGRGDFVRLLFEEAGVPYDDIQENDVVIKIMNSRRGGDATGYPVFAPPIVAKGSFRMCQTQAILRHLGTLFGLCPDTPEGFAHADQICHTVTDFHGEGRSAFHPIKHTGSHKIQVEESKPFIKEFLQTRFLTYLVYFEAILKANEGGHGFFIGDKITYADISVFHVMRCAAAQFPEAWEAADVPLLKAFHERMQSRPRIADFLASPRSQPFAGDSMM